MSKKRKVTPDAIEWHNKLGDDVLDVLEARPIESERRTLGIVLGSVLRICSRANGMIERGDLWRLRKKPSADDVLDVVFDSVRDSEREYRQWRSDEKANAGEREVHPMLAVAEQLAAKALATFGGRDAVKDLERWKKQADHRIPQK